MRTFFIGDIHGNITALHQVLERSNFDFSNDLLITAGDIVDGLPWSFECVEVLLKIKNRIDLRGNHDDTFNHWLQTGFNKYHWSQGGLETAKSFARVHDVDLHTETWSEKNVFGHTQEYYNVSIKHYSCRQDIADFFKKQINYYVDDQNRAFVHAGYEDVRGVGHDNDSTYIWSRKLWERHAMINSQEMPNLLRPYDEIYIGHTTTMNWGIDKPMNKWNVWNIDTGAGYNGRLSMINVDTKEVFQSETVKEIYGKLFY